RAAAMKKILAVCVALCLAGAARAADTVTEKDMKAIGLAYHNYLDAKAKPPAKAEDLAPYLPKADAKRLVEALKSAEVKFIYNVRVVDMTAGSSNTVVAYVKGIEKAGGLVLYGDGSVRKLTAAQFKKATLAKPKK